jgi:tRNA (guanine-N7-)-methyltransferase
MIPVPARRPPALYEPPDYFRRLRREEIFPDASRPLEIDLGCGDGRFLVALAARHVERDFLGIERLLGRARKVARRVSLTGLGNVQVFRIESSYAVIHLLPESAVSRVHLLFPDPWPKKRHHKNRLVTTEFCAALHRVLGPAGEWLMKSDDGGFLDAAREIVAASGRFAEIAWPAEAFFYPPTDFEAQWSEAGREIHRIRWRKTQD